HPHPQPHLQHQSPHQTECCHPGPPSQHLSHRPRCTKSHRKMTSQATLTVPTHLSQTYTHQHTHTHTHTHIQKHPHSHHAQAHSIDVYTHTAVELTVIWCDTFIQRHNANQFTLTASASPLSDHVSRRQPQTHS